MSPSKDHPNTARPTRAERLAAELRENLKRRKEKARRTGPEPAAATRPSPPSPAQNPKEDGSDT